MTAFLALVHNNRYTMNHSFGSISSKKRFASACQECAIFLFTDDTIAKNSVTLSKKANGSK